MQPFIIIFILLIILYIIISMNPNFETFIIEPKHNMEAYIKDQLGELNKQQVEINQGTDKYCTIDNSNETARNIINNKRSCFDYNDFGIINKMNIDSYKKIY